MLQCLDESVHTTKNQTFDLNTIKIVFIFQKAFGKSCYKICKILKIRIIILDAATEGLFRISGNKKRQEELKSELNKSTKLELYSEECCYTAHDIAGVLKHFFSELPEPLLTKSCYVCYQQLAGKLKG